MPKRSSLLSLLGEFVALNKNPEFRLSTTSNQIINEAIKSEYEQTKNNNTQVLHIMFDVSI